MGGLQEANILGGFADATKVDDDGRAGYLQVHSLSGPPLDLARWSDLPDHDRDLSGRGRVGAVRGAYVR
jgi:hypothetical protein